MTWVPSSDPLLFAPTLGSTTNVKDLDIHTPTMTFVIDKSPNTPGLVTIDLPDRSYRLQSNTIIQLTRNNSLWEGWKPIVTPYGVAFQGYNGQWLNFDGKSFVSTDSMNAFQNSFLVEKA